MKCTCTNVRCMSCHVLPISFQTNGDRCLALWVGLMSWCHDVMMSLKDLMSLRHTSPPLPIAWRSRPQPELGPESRNLEQAAVCENGGILWFLCIQTASKIYQSVSFGTAYYANTCTFTSDMLITLSLIITYYIYIPILPSKSLIKKPHFGFTWFHQQWKVCNVTPPVI